MDYRTRAILSIILINNDNTFFGNSILIHFGVGWMGCTTGQRTDFRQLAVAKGAAPRVIPAQAGCQLTKSDKVYL